MVADEKTKIDVIFVKHIFFIVLLLTNLIFIAPALSDFCCQTSSGSNTFQCYSSGYCCKISVEDNGALVEYWHPNGCFDFEVWVEPSNMAFTVGKTTPVNLYVHNLERYTDRYNIDYNVTSLNPSLISVDMTGVTPTDSVAPNEIKVLHPRITVLSKDASGTVFFNVTSWGNNQKQKDAFLVVISSNMPISLDEFDSSLILWVLIVIIIGVIYFLNQKKLNLS